MAVDQSAETTAEGAPPQAPENGQPADAGEQAKSPGFRTRGGIRRRVRFLRKARELAYRDLGGLVFDLHRFGQRNDALVMAKLATLGQIDSELRALEASLGEDRPVTVLREAGITACPRCAAIHSGEDHFCPRCGLPMSRNVDLPVAAAPPVATGPAVAEAPATAVHAAAPAPATATAVHAAAPPPAPAPDTAVHAAATPASAPAEPPGPAPAYAGAQAGSPAPPTTPPAGDEPTEILRPPPTDA